MGERKEVGMTGWKEEEDRVRVRGQVIQKRYAHGVCSKC